jgi:Fur family ferric uptake transcriptional regulator
MRGRHGQGQGMRGICPRWTMPRDAILSFLQKTKEHVSAKDVFQELQRSFPGLGLTTVYRTLDLLIRAGIVTRIYAGDGQYRYEHAAGGEKGHHHHLICTSCGRIQDYRDFEEEELELVTKTEAKLSRKFGFEIGGHNIEFLGICATCRERGISARLGLRASGAGPDPESDSRKGD